MPWFYYVARATMRMLLFLLCRWQVRGKDNVPSHGPLLIVSNHLNLADPPLLGVSIGRKMMFMAKEELFGSRVGAYFIRGFGAFPVRRGRLDRLALRQADQVLARGFALAMFPEGMRSQSAQLRPAFLGSAMIAARNNTPLLPVGITGTEKIRGLTWMLRRPRITVNIGRPFLLPVCNCKLTREELARLTDMLMLRIAELLPPEYRGDYAAREAR
ncbi:MAG: 1-acyl-sn-glycerol-3-phosphate acyltransferase [Chloroflexi bacterium]|nr:1-acyl-sn-glycerol-3-phosphate acyltransferase [Chloroflexota bacterium]